MSAALLLALAAPSLAGSNCRTGGSGATLLYPFFEVDLNDPFGLTTLVAFTNESNSKRMVRVVLWTDWAIPTLAFDTYLSEFDVQTVNIRDLLNGNLPSTGVGMDLSAFEQCNIAALDPANPPLAPAQSANLRAAHTGLPASGSNCKGEAYGDSVARGYITIDVVDQCSGVEVGAPQVTPANKNLPYFGSVALDSNVLNGDYFYVNPANNSAQGNEAVAIWTDSARFTGADDFTFYGRYHNWDGRDHRVPLSSVWSARFANGGSFDGGTEFLVWRDTRSSNISPANCAVGPTWHPLVENFISERDEGADRGLTVQDTSFFDLATQGVTIDDLNPPHTFGRVQFGLSQPGGPAQAWLSWRMTALGKYSVLQSGSPVIDNCEVDPTP